MYALQPHREDKCVWDQKRDLSYEGDRFYVLTNPCRQNPQIRVTNQRVQEVVFWFNSIKNIQLDTAINFMYSTGSAGGTAHVYVH